jgi:uncharacterized protein
LTQAAFSGYASLFGKRDLEDDVVVKGAFKASLLRRKPRGIRMLFQHDVTMPIGTWLDVYEDERGLFCNGRLNLEVARARELKSLLEHGGIDGLSIGYKACHSVTKKGIRYLHEIDLIEISIVTFPMLHEARAKLI